MSNEEDKDRYGKNSTSYKPDSFSTGDPGCEPKKRIKQRSKEIQGLVQERDQHVLFTRLCDIRNRLQRKSK